MKILITGAGGMLGSEFVRTFSNDKKFDVVGLKRTDCDLTDFSKTFTVMKNESPDLIIHCAAQVGGIQANINHPVDFLLNNLLIDTSVVKSATMNSISKFIYIGSSCMYPKDYRQPLVESDILAAPLEQTNEGYALAKISGSRLASFVSKEFGWAYKTLIPSNLYGPGDTFSEISSHLVAATLLKAHKAKTENAQEIEVWGDGTAKREFTFIEDLSNWLVSEVGNIQEFPDVLNVGAGVDFSIDEYYEQALEVVGHKARLKHDIGKPVGMKAKLMDSSLAREKFAWNPKTTLKEGMAKTYQSFLSSMV